MSNTHRLEILRLAEAPDGTKIWSGIKTDDEWLLLKEVGWTPDNIYAVDDGFFVEERKHFARHGEIYYYSSSQEQWVLTKATSFEEGVKYCITPPKPQWYELESNIGRLIWVGDSQVKRRQYVREFLCFKCNQSSPFVTTDGREWQYARLLEPNEIAKEAENV